ncbi:gliding motility-associated C-terminal domain-containing protein [Bacteroidota bacterium]
MYVNSPLTLGFISNSACFGDTITFTDTSISGSLITSVTWDMNNDNIFTDDTGSVVKKVFAAPGVYNVGLRITTSTNTDTLYKVVSVFETPTTDFTFNDACQGATSKLYSMAMSSDTIIKYYWDFNNDGTPDDSSGANVSNTFTVAGPNLVGHAVVTNKGCFSYIVKAVAVSFQPNADFTTSNNCVGDSTRFINQTVLTNDTLINYHWDYGDGFDAIIKHDHAHFYSTPNTYSVQLVALSNKGCRDTITKSITIYDKPQLTLILGGSPIIYAGQTVSITADPGPYDSVFWSSGQTTTSISASTAGIYSVRVVDANNCSVMDSTEIKVLFVNEFKVNEVLTPNQDNINDYWLIYDLPYFAPVEVSIYNRWGDELYNSSGYQNTWDATYKGETLPEGTYYYIARTKNGDVYKGSINVIR